MTERSPDEDLDYPLAEDPPSLEEKVFGNPRRYIAIVVALTLAATALGLKLRDNRIEKEIASLNSLSLEEKVLRVEIGYARIECKNEVTGLKSAVPDLPVRAEATRLLASKTEDNVRCCLIPAY